MAKQVDLVQGTLDMLILKTVSLGGLHGYGISVRIRQLTGGQLQIQQGSLYPALYRLENQRLIASKWVRVLPVRNPAGLVFVRTAGTAGRDGPPYP